MLGRILAVLLFGWCFTALPAAAQEIGLKDLKFITEENPPANFVENGEVKGIAVDLLNMIWSKLEQSGQPEIDVWSWDQGYRFLLTRPGTVLFSTTFTDERDQLGIKWAGPIKSNNLVLLAKKDRGVKIRNLEDARNYIVAAIPYDSSEQFLLKNGLENHVIPANSFGDMIDGLVTGKFDVIARGYNVLASGLKKRGENIDDYEIVHILKESKHFYAFHPSTPDSVVAQFQSAIETLEDERLELLDKY